MFYFTPLPGFFSPFPHGTRLLLVTYYIFVLRGGPREFKGDFTCPPLLGSIQYLTIKTLNIKII